MKKKIKDLTWKEFLHCRENGTGDYDLNCFVWGFCAFVRANWTSPRVTYSGAFKYFNEEVLNKEVEVNDNI